MGYLDVLAPLTAFVVAVVSGVIAAGAAIGLPGFWSEKQRPVVSLVGLAVWVLSVSAFIALTIPSN